MDELHQQTVSLLSFQSLPREQYDAQVAFNLLPLLGSAAKVKLAATQARIAEEYAALSAEVEPARLRSAEARRAWRADTSAAHRCTRNPLPIGPPLRRPLLALRACDDRSR